MGEEARLRAQRHGSPVVYRVDLLLPGVAEFVEESVRVVLLYLRAEHFERAGILGRAGGEVELPVELVNAKPVFAISVKTVIKRGDLVLRGREFAQKVGGRAERRVQFPIAVGPDAALASTDGIRHLARSSSSRRSREQGS